MLTPFGKAVRKHRIDRGMTLKDMADALKVKSSYLSAIETGRKNVNEQLVTRIADLLRLSAGDFAELREAAAKSLTAYKISLETKSPEKRELAASFARRFSELDQAEVKKLLKILNS